MELTPIQHRDNILDKLKGLTNYVNRLNTVITDMDLSKPNDNIETLENYILMIQGQKEFVKQSIQQMRDVYGK